MALVSACHKEATGLARSFGARFYPVAGFSPASINSVVEDVISHWNIPDTFISVFDGNNAEANNAFLTVDYSRFEQTPGTLRIINIMAGEGGDALGMSLNGLHCCRAPEQLYHPPGKQSVESGTHHSGQYRLCGAGGYARASYHFVYVYRPFPGYRRGLQRALAACLQ